MKSRSKLYRLREQKGFSQKGFTQEEISSREIGERNRRDKMSTKKAIGGSIGAIIILIISQLLAQLIGSVLVIIKVPMGFCNIIAGALYLIFSYVLLKLLAQKILKMEVKSLGIPQFHINAKWIVIGFALPLLVSGIYLLLPGEYVSSKMNNMQIFSTLSAGIVFNGIAAGFVEEMVSRGFILNLLKNRWNKKIAIFVPSVLFGAVHVIGMNFSILSCLLVLVAGTLVGIMFSLIELENQSIWNSGIVHVIWNILIIGGGFTVVETPDEYSVITYVLTTKNFAITGGEFGIESSIIAVIAYILVIIFTFYMTKRKRSCNVD